MDTLTASGMRVRAALVSQAVATDATWFSVVDAAASASLPSRAITDGLTVRSLYAGEMGRLLEDVAPRLVAFQWRDGFSHVLMRSWPRSVGIILQSRAGFEEICRHLRRFLMVKDQAGKKYRFRFYDPRVLRAFLPVCTPDELAQFFGPIERFYTPTRDGQGVLSFRLHEGALRVRRLHSSAGEGGDGPEAI